MGKQAEGTGRHWYVVHTYSGYEDAVREALLQRIESLGMQDSIFDVVVPKETQIVIKKGEPKTEKKRIFPGYVLVDMLVTDYSWYVVRNTPNVTGFVGSGTTPVPVSRTNSRLSNAEWAKRSLNSRLTSRLATTL